MEGEKEGKVLSKEHLLYRGASLKNTEWMYGVVVYTGKDTKLVMNSKKAKLKRSNVEKKLNLYIFAVFVLLFVMCGTCTVGFGVWSKKKRLEEWYLFYPNNNSLSLDTFVSFLTFFVLFGGYLVPISLYVTLELVKVCQAFYINNDINMYYEANDTPALTRSSGLTEELGQVHYIFSDKTGTLTQNQMQFRKCSIGGVKYGLGYTEISLAKARKEKEKVEERLIRKDSELEDKYVNFVDNNFLDDSVGESLIEKLEEEEEGESVVDEYFKCLSLCHTIIPQDKREGKYERFYQSASPDEAALVRAARYFGYELVDRNDERIVVKRKGKLLEYIPLQIIEFSSKRKRMSVLMREKQTGQVYLYCKGADDVIFDRLDKSVEQPLRKPTSEHLEEFGNDGLRTLAIAYRKVPPQFYEEWCSKWNEVERMVGERSKVNKEKAKLAEEIEVQLTLLGATALEDKLQEGVPDAISTLLKAGIKMWVLTGDKLETAINISYATSLIDDSMDLMQIDYDWPKRALSREQLEEEEIKAEAVISSKIDHYLSLLDKRNAHLLPSSSSKLGRGSSFSPFSTSSPPSPSPSSPIPNKRKSKKVKKESILKDASAFGGESESEEENGKKREGGGRKGEKEGGEIELEEISIESEEKGKEEKGEEIEVEVEGGGGEEEDEGEETEFERDELALVITGLALKYALLPSMEERFERLTRSCKSVVCCRVSPSQKAEVVSLVKRKQNIISLAIGDGANDVSMIQEAHVGVGINGEEGSQASRTADFAIGQFRFLVPLLLIHGRYSYRRVSKLIQYSFYKNCVLTWTQFLFCLFNAFTGTSMYESWTLSVYNVVFTSLPVITFAILDEDVGRKFVLTNPQLYMEGQKNRLFTPSKFIGWMVNGVAQSTIIFFVCLGAFYKEVITSDGITFGMYSWGLVVYTCVIIVVTFKLAMESLRWVWFHHLTVWGSIVVYFIWDAIYATIYPSTGLGIEYYYVFYNLVQSGVFYFTVIATTICALLYNYTYLYLRRTYSPRNHHIIAELEKMGRVVKLKEERKEKKERRKRRKEERRKKKNETSRVYTGFAFVSGISEQIMKEDISKQK